jgi:hypothetical protein
MAGSTTAGRPLAALALALALAWTWTWTLAWTWASDRPGAVDAMAAVDDTDGGGAIEAAGGAASGSAEIAAGSFIEAVVVSAPDRAKVIAAGTVGGAETASDNTESWWAGPRCLSGRLPQNEGPDRLHAANPATKPRATTVTTTPAARRLGTSSNESK